MEAACGIDTPRDHIGGEHMRAVRVWVSQEVGEGNGGKGIIVCEGRLVEFHHYGWTCGVKGICACVCTEGRLVRSEEKVVRDEMMRIGASGQRICSLLNSRPCPLL